MNMTGKDIILGLLIEKSRSGYEINEVFETVFRYFYKTSYGMRYPTLRRLEKELLVEKNIVIQEGKPNKNIYNITKKGIEEFHCYLKSPIDPEKRESEFLVRMYFGGEEEKTIIANWLRSRLSLLENDINQLMSNHKEWRDKMSYTQIIAYEIGLAQFLAEKQVIENKLKELTEKAE